MTQNEKRVDLALPAITDLLIQEIESPDKDLRHAAVHFSAGELHLLLTLTRQHAAKESRRSRAQPALDALIQALEEGLEDLSAPLSAAQAYRQLVQETAAT